MSLLVSSNASDASSSLMQPPRAWWMLSLPLLGFLILPLAALLVRTSPADLWANLSQPSVYRTALLSLKTSAISTTLTVLLGTPLAYVMARRSFPLKRTLDTLIDLPMVLPPAVAGVALLMTFGRRGVVGSLLADWGVTIVFTQTAVVMAQTFVAAPLFIRSAIVGFANVDSDLEESALIDGASTWQVFRYVTLPLTRGALLSGALLTWARALGEFGATIIFAGNMPGRTQTMPLAIYLGFELNLDAALTLSVLLIGASFATLLGIRRLLL